MEHSRLAGQLRCMILLRESDIDINLLAGLGTNQLLLEAGDEASAAQSQCLILCGSTGELFLTAPTLIVQHQLVAILCGAVVDNLNLGGLLVQTLHLGVNLLVGDNITVKLSLKALIDEFHGNNNSLCK